MGFHSHKRSVKFYIERGTGIVANESTEGSVCNSGAATTEPIAEKASPADSLTCSREPFVDCAAA